MARVTRKIKLSNDVDSAVQAFETVLKRYGYENKLVKGEDVWAIDGGGIIGCFAYIFTDDCIEVQTWIRDMLLGEIGLDGFYAGLMKKQMKKILEDIEYAIKQS